MKMLINKFFPLWRKTPLTTRVIGGQLLLVIFISSIVFIGLGNSSLLDYDEGIHAQVAKEIIQSNDWVTLHFGGKPRFEKPPLYNWTTALFFKTFYINEFWARAGSALSSVLSAIVIYFLGSAIYNRRVGVLAVIPLISGYEFLRQARNGTTDVMLTFFILITLTAYTKLTQKNQSGWYFVWISFALGFMVKFWAAVIVMIAIGVNLMLQKGVINTLRCKHFYRGALIALILILPWHLTMYLIHGQAFVDRYFLHNLLERSANSLEGNTGSTRYYFDRMAYDYSAWFFLLPTALTMEVRRVLSNRDKTSVLLIFVLCTFGIYSLLVSTKIFHYLTPIYPVLAIFNAAVLIKAYEDHRSFAFSGLVVASLVAAIIPSTRFIGAFLLLVSFLIAAIWIARFLNSHFGFSSELPSSVSTVLRLIISASKRLLILLASLSEKRYLPKLLVIIMCLFLTLISVSRSRSLYRIVESPVEQIARVAGTSNTIRDETIIALALPPNYENAIVGPAAMFYSDRPIEVAWTKDALALYTSEGSREIIMGESFINLLEGEYEFTILARYSPYIYGTVQQRGE